MNKIFIGMIIGLILVSGAMAIFACSVLAGGDAVCEQMSYIYNLGHFCDDTSGWDAIVTCMAKVP